MNEEISDADDRREFIGRPPRPRGRAVAGIPPARRGAGDGAARDGRRRRQVVEGAMPLLRHRLRRDGGGEGQPRGRHAWRPEAEVNSGLNCVKGYFLSKIMYGEDRLTTPLLRMKDGQVRQGRRVRARLLGHRPST